MLGYYLQPLEPLQEIRREAGIGKSTKAENKNSQ
jgi:hypothetical protein